MPAGKSFRKGEKPRPLTARELRRAEENTGRIDLGLCPNGCGPLTVTDANNDDCPKCGFHYWHNRPH